MKAFFALALVLVSPSANASNPPEPPKTVDVQVASCGPFELWNRLQPKSEDPHETNFAVVREWARLEGKDIPLKETSAFTLMNRSETLECTIRSLVSADFNEVGDRLRIASTCGLFIPNLVSPSFAPEQVLYVFDKRGDLLKKGLCKKSRAPNTTN
jgi:hypothetical protein